MAEAVFRDLVSYSTTNQHPLISRIDSCGTGAYHRGADPDPRTLAVLQRAGIKGYKHEARKLRASDFGEFDYVIGMDEENVQDIRSVMGRGDKAAGKKVWLYGAFGGKSEEEEVQDPYYGGKDGFEVAHEQVKRFGRGLLEHLEKQATEGSD